VKNGGSVIATYETSLCDEWGVRRKDFGLADLFGVGWKGRVEGPMQNSYLRLEHDTARDHQLLKGLEDAPRIVNGVWRLEVEPREKFAQVPLTLIPSYPDLPMEKVFPRVEKTDVAQVYLREFKVEQASSLPSEKMQPRQAGSLPHSSGRVVYFPWDIDRTFWEVLSVDHFKLLRNAVEWATNEEPPVSVSGVGVLDVTAWRQKNSVTVHLVNLTNPMMMKGPLRELIPVSEQQVRLRLPDGARVSKVHLLAADRKPRFTQRGRDLHVVVPSILDHEIVAIDL
jgi:hypothetical protein